MKFGWLLAPLFVGNLACTTVLGIDGSYDDQEDGGTGLLGGSGGVGAAGTGGGTGGLSTGTEICDNGVDDDENGKIDCADPQCTGGGYTCVDPAPAGFVGPVAWFADQTCGAPFATEHAKGGIDVTVPGGGTCPSCACGSPSGARCGVDATLYNQSGCTGSSKAEVFVATGTCLNVGDQAFGPKSVRLSGVPRVVEGSCTPSSTGQKSFQNPSFTNDVRACRANAGAGCSGGQVCAPPTGEGAFCIAQDGDVTCPNGFAKRLLYRAWLDGRDCTACSCDAPTGTCNASNLPSLFDPDSGCSTGEIPLTSACKSIPIHPSFGTYSTRTSSVSPTGVTCKASGGVTTGGVTPSDPVTVCCKPAG